MRTVGSSNPSVTKHIGVCITPCCGFISPWGGSRAFSLTFLRHFIQICPYYNGVTNHQQLTMAVQMRLEAKCRHFSLFFDNESTKLPIEQARVNYSKKLCHVTVGLSYKNIWMAWLQDPTVIIESTRTHKLGQNYLGICLAISIMVSMWLTPKWKRLGMFDPFFLALVFKWVHVKADLIRWARHY